MKNIPEQWNKMFEEITLEKLKLNSEIAYKKNSNPFIYREYIKLYT